jgi:hypothetical protein
MYCNHRRKFRSQTSDNIYGQMEKQRWGESEKKRAEGRRSEKFREEKE